MIYMLWNVLQQTYTILAIIESILSLFHNFNQTAMLPVVNETLSKTLSNQRDIRKMYCLSHIEDWTILLSFCRHLSCILWNENYTLMLWFKLHRRLFLRIHLSVLVWGNYLLSVYRLQTITRINDDPIDWRIYASPELNMFTRHLAAMLPSITKTLAMASFGMTETRIANECVVQILRGLNQSVIYFTPIFYYFAICSSSLKFDVFIKWRHVSRGIKI